jgi:ATP-dependent Lon protease
MHQDVLDPKVTRTFAGKVVRKDLLHQIKGGENVPSYVLEYLLGRYCASDDEDEIRIGIEAVKETLRSDYFRHDEANKAQALVEQRGRHRFIDRVEVRFLAGESKYWAAMDHFSYAKIHAISFTIMPGARSALSVTGTSLPSTRSEEFELKTSMPSRS